MDCYMPLWYCVVVEFVADDNAALNWYLVT